MSFHFHFSVIIPSQTNPGAASMASRNLLSLPVFLALIINGIFAADPPSQSIDMYPFLCSDLSVTCNSILFQNNHLTKEQICNFYSVNASQIVPVRHDSKENRLVTVPCSCKNVNGTVGYFYDTPYVVQPNDTFQAVSENFYSGQAWPVGNEDQTYIAGNISTMHLLCGCVEKTDQIVVTYTVQPQDTLFDIATLLSAEVDEIQSSNSMLTQRPGYIEVGWVLFVPKHKNGIPPPPKQRRTNHKWTIIIGILSAVTVLSICTLALILMMRKRSREHSEEYPKAGAKSMNSHKSFSTQNQYLRREHMEDITGFESERPVVCHLEEIAEATNNFDDTRKIGEGGYGSVYFGILGEQEVAIKKMRSNKSKEFLAELKVLCKIHHINVVELLGYASGDDHLYLVYEYVSNGSLSDHLHDPLLKGHQPLSWTARAQIALDAAKGIEYIHDHTKERYVHRDIKTTNILLDEGLRAKVADFGLAKLVGRTNDDDFIATRLVGTPGYLPPESVKELQVTIKTDVFAFGVVLAELITGQRALIRDNREHNKMKSLITVVNKVFEDDDPEGALEAVTDANLRSSYPVENVYKMAEIADWCLCEDAVNRPEMQEVVVALSRLVMSSIEWEASLGGSSQVFSGVFNGR